MRLNRPIFVHIFAISITLALMVLNYFSNENIFEQTWQQAFFYIMPTVCLLIVNNFVLLPYLFERQKTTEYFLLLFCSILITQTLTGIFTFPNYFNLQINLIVLDFIKYFIIVSAGFGYIALQRLAEQQSRNYEQQLLIRQSELNALKRQINPHFLFNTLNNIYYACLERSENAAEMIEKLANLMRYTLENTEKEYVFLEKEYNFIKNYVDLEKNRLSQPNNVRLTQKGDFGNTRFAPLILITFVENCFKHGAHKNVENPKIDIFIELKNKELIFYCENAKFSHTDKRTQSGTGLGNTQKRLELLYPNRHILTIDDTADTYTVSLIVQL
jgi:two-component system, LytTR family, sensor kinase